MIKLTTILLLLALIGCYSIPRKYLLTSKKNYNELMEFEIKELKGGALPSKSNGYNTINLLIKITNKSNSVINIVTQGNNLGYLFSAPLQLRVDCNYIHGRRDINTVFGYKTIEPNMPLIDTLVFEKCENFSGELYLMYNLSVYNENQKRISKENDSIISNSIMIE